MHKYILVTAMLLPLCLHGMHRDIEDNNDYSHQEMRLKSAFDPEDNNELFEENFSEYYNRAFKQGRIVASEENKETTVSFKQLQKMYAFATTAYAQNPSTQTWGGLQEIRTIASHRGNQKIVKAIDQTPRMHQN